MPRGEPARSPRKQTPCRPGRGGERNFFPRYCDPLDASRNFAEKENIVRDRKGDIDPRPLPATVPCRPGFSGKFPKSSRDRIGIENSAVFPGETHTPTPSEDMGVPFHQRLVSFEGRLSRTCAHATAYPIDVVTFGNGSRETHSPYMPGRKERGQGEERVFAAYRSDSGDRFLPYFRRRS
jgi:hypothetical protein